MCYELGPWCIRLHGGGSDFEIQDYLFGRSRLRGNDAQANTATRFGKPVAQIPPPPSCPSGVWFGAMQNDGEIREDLVEPAMDLSEWEILEFNGDVSLDIPIHYHQT